MKTIILSMFAGMFFWQLVTTLVLICTDEDEDKTIFCGCGIWALLIKIIGFCYHSISLAIARYRYNLYEFHSPKGVYHLAFYMTAKTASFFRQYDIYGKNYTIVKAEQDMKSVPTKGMIIKNISELPTGMNAEFFKKFLLQPIDKE